MKGRIKKCRFKNKKPRLNGTETRGGTGGASRFRRQHLQSALNANQQPTSSPPVPRLDTRVQKQLLLLSVCATGKVFDSGNSMPPFAPTSQLLPVGHLCPFLRRGGFVSRCPFLPSSPFDFGSCFRVGAYMCVCVRTWGRTLSGTGE